MKKFFNLALVLTFAIMSTVTFTSCGSNDDDNDGINSDGSDGTQSSFVAQAVTYSLGSGAGYSQMQVVPTSATGGYMILVPSSSSSAKVKGSRSSSSSPVTAQYTVNGNVYTLVDENTTITINSDNTLTIQKGSDAPVTTSFSNTTPAVDAQTASVIGVWNISQYIVEKDGNKQVVSMEQQIAAGDVYTIKIIITNGYYMAFVKDDTDGDFIESLPWSWHNGGPQVAINGHYEDLKGLTWVVSGNTLTMATTYPSENTTYSMVFTKQ